jgi:hypothetical protein
MLWWSHQRWHFLLTIILMSLATADVAFYSPRFLTAVFNPMSLNILMTTLALVGWMTSRDLPSASRCLRSPKEPRTK